MTITTRDNVTIDFTDFAFSGTLSFDPEYGLLELDTLDGEMPERLSTHLGAYGLDCPEGHTWIKDWSEHQGVTDSLVKSGLVEIVRTETVGPFNSTAHLVKILF